MCKKTENFVLHYNRPILYKQRFPCSDGNPARRACRAPTTSGSTAASTFKRPRHAAPAEAKTPAVAKVPAEAKATVEEETPTEVEKRVKEEEEAPAEAKAQVEEEEAPAEAEDVTLREMFLIRTWASSSAR
jgi:hypothetical protein